MILKDFRKNFSRRFRTHYILVLRSKETLEDKLTVTLTPLNVVLLFSGVLVLFSVLILFLLTRTPLKEYVYGNEEQKRKTEILELSYLKDTMEREIMAMETERKNLLTILMGRDSIYETAPKPDTGDQIEVRDFDKISEEEEEFRKLLESGELSKMSAVPYSGSNFYTPLQGHITDTFNVKTKHFALDIVAPKNTPVKSILNGTVILSTWTPDNGNVLIIQHANNFISVYKHNAAILKETGGFVTAGEPVALVGNTGELSSGYHLHFELWQKGIPVNPKDFILF
ncbi:MAG: M23 family metallopeptidase [Flavobacteriales bacterium]|nr:M23 family metallopeptidase [Flavobacteriales bacterium]